MDSHNSRNQKALLKLTETTYPRVANLPKAIRHKVNCLIREAAAAAVPQYDPGTTVIEAWSSYKTTTNQNGILSLRFEVYFYPELAAHGVTGISSITLNLLTGHPYCLGELFRRGSNYQMYVNRIIQDQIVAGQIPLLKPFDGISPTENYYLTPDSLVIYYLPSVYTSSAYGVLEFVIPYPQITALIDPSGPVGLILQISEPFLRK
ncbi:MAG TPA: DUF3298 domain-containing protein [Bacillota bacterium]